MYGCVEDHPTIEVLQSDNNFKTWKRIRTYRMPCYSSSQGVSHTIAVNGDHIHIACACCGIEYVFTMSFELNFASKKMYKSGRSIYYGTIKVNHNSDFMDIVDVTKNIFIRYDENGRTNTDQQITWQNIKVIDLLLHDNLLFAVCLEHKRVIKVVLDQIERQPVKYCTRL